MYFFPPPPRLFHALQMVRGEPRLSSVQSYRWVGVTPPGGFGSSGQEAEKIKALLVSGQPETRGSHQIWNSDFSASYIMRLRGKSCPIPFSLIGWQQTSLQEDAFEHFFPKINFFRKNKRLRRSAETRFLPTHTHMCFSNIFFIVPNSNSRNIALENYWFRTNAVKSQVLHFCQFLQCLLLSCSILRSPDSCRSYSR